ncbi:MAG: hypothetical protein PVG95_12730, partial [Methyloceanibacter sp.]
MTLRTLFVCMLIFCGVVTALNSRSSFAQDQTTGQESPSSSEQAARDTTQESAYESLPTEVLQPDIDIEELELRLAPLTKDELERVAKEWLQIVKSKTEGVIEAQIAMSRSDGKVEEAVRKKLTELSTERNQLFDKYSAVLNSWEKKGGDETAIADYRAYRSSIIIEETSKADLKMLSAQVVAWLTSEDGGVQLATKIAIVIASFFGLVIVARLVRRIVRRWIGRVPNISNLLQAFVIGIVYWLVLAFGLMLVLAAIGINVTPLFALVGGASFILAFAM